MPLRFWVWHRQAGPSTGIRLNGGDWLPGGGAKQSGVDGSGARADMLSHARTCGQTCTRFQYGAHACKPKKNPQWRAGTCERGASKLEVS
jgi:hypothetical protein